MAKRNDLPKITEQQIRAIASPESFSRGMSYYHDGAIHRPVRRGRTLIADCAGTSLYRVTVELDKQGVGTTSCTCPYEWGGACKHIVALLLTWLNAPKDFQTQDDATALLASMSKEQLIELVENVLRREPDFYDLIQRKASKAQAEQETINLTTLRRLIRDTLKARPPEEYHDEEEYYDDEDEYRSKRDWEDLETLGEELQEYLDYPRDWVKQGNREQGVAAYQMLVEESVAYLKKLGHEDYEVEEFATECATELIKLTKRDDATRATLFEWALNLAGGHPHPVAVLDAVIDGVRSDADIPRIEKFYKDQLAKNRKARPAQAGYYWNPWADRLLKFYEHAKRTDDMLALLLEEGRVLAHAQKLLELRRREESVQAALENLTTANDCLTFAKQLADKGNTDDAITVAEKGLKDRQAWKGELLEWLTAQYEKRGDRARALETAIARYQARPEEMQFKQVKKLAHALERWESVRADLIAFLEKSHFRHMLVDIYLDEGNLDAAERVAGQTYFYGDIRPRVARAAEKVDPRRAIALYQELATEQIKHKHRTAYSQAVEYLQRTKKLLHTLGKSEMWDAYLANLRKSYPTLRALQEELNRL
jgi:uncharacterized Zn finger protein